MGNIINEWKFMIELLVNNLKKPFTKKYPKEKLVLDKHVRGKLIYNRETCIGCKLCVNVCPANALQYDEKTKKVRGHRGICIYCGDCSRVCPTKPKSIYFSTEFENAVYKKKDLIFD